MLCSTMMKLKQFEFNLLSQLVHICFYGASASVGFASAPFQLPAWPVVFGCSLRSQAGFASIRMYIEPLR